MAELFSEPAERSPGARSATFISGFALAGRVAERLGAFGQVALIASVYGSGYLADRYFIASIVPLIIGAITGEALSANILPALVRNQGDERPLLAAGVWLSCGLLVLVTACYIGVATVVVRIASPAGSNALGVWYALAPIGLLLGLAGYLSGVLTYFERFVWPPFRSAVSTLGALTFTLIVIAFTHSLMWVGLATTLGYALSLLTLLIEVRRVTGRGSFGVPPSRVFSRAASLGRGLGSPLLGGLLGGQVFVLIERLLASTVGVGAVATLSYARGIVFTPTIVSQSVALGIYPGMVRSYELRDFAHVRGSVERGLRVTLFLGFVLAAFFALFGHETVHALLQRGAFSARDAHHVGNVLSAFAPALAGTMIMIFVARVFYAVDYFRAVVWTQLAAFVVYAVIALPLRAGLGTTGLALAFGIAELGGACFGLALAARRTGLRAVAALRDAVAPATGRAAVVVIVLGLLRVAFSLAPLDSLPTFRLLIALAGGAIASAAVLWSSSWPELGRLKRGLRRLAPSSS